VIPVDVRVSDNYDNSSAD